MVCLFLPLPLPSPQTQATAQWQARCGDLTQKLAAQQQETAGLTAALAKAEAARQRLHYTLMELKGNLRVVCRGREDARGRQWDGRNP